MYKSVLRITDGTTTVDLLNLNGWLLRSWRPSVPEPKGGGVFRSSPLTDGRKLSSRRIDNIFDTFNLVGSGANQNNMIHTIQELQRLMEKAVSYWISDWQKEPVWIEARASCEEEIRYAVVVDYRLEGFGSPYEQPFFNAVNMVASEASLTIEHQVWQGTQPVSDGDCVEVSARVYYSDLQPSTDGTFEPAASGQDIDVIINTKACDITSDHATFGTYAIGVPKYQTKEAGVIFDNVTIPVGATIVRAYITFTAYENIGAADLDVNISAEVPAVSNYTGTWPDWIGRSYLYDAGLPSLIPNTTVWTTPVWVADATYTTCSLVEILQRVIDAAGWVNGGEIGIKLAARNPSDIIPGARSFWTFDNTDARNPPQLYIEWITTAGDYLGRDATCENEVFVCNKHNYAPISHIYWFDADGAPPNDWSPNLIAAALPYDLLPAVPAVGDMLYIGSSTAMANGGVFNNVVFDIKTPQDGSTILVWKYYDGAAFDEIDESGEGYICGNLLLTDEDVNSISFRAPEDWATTAVNGVTGYWIVGEVTAIGGAPSPPEQQNREIYTSVLPYVDIDSAQVKGDIPALSRILFDCNACMIRPTATLSAGLRSIDRGEYFTAYLNASDEQAHYGITFSVYEGALADASEAPTGRNLDCSSFAGTTLTQICAWYFDPDVSIQYPGTYHAFVRVRQTTGVLGAVKFRLRSVFGTGYNVAYSDTTTTYRVDKIVTLDLGQLSIKSPYSMREGDNPTSMYLILDAATTGGEDFEVYDVVLLPSDEWIGTFAAAGVGADEVLAYTGKQIEVDGITNPRMYRAFLNTIIDDDDSTIDAELFRIASSHPILQSNKDQRLWFLQTYQTYLEAYFEATGKVRLQSSPRYILMRGDR